MLKYTTTHKINCNTIIVIIMILYCTTTYIWLLPHCFLLENIANKLGTTTTIIIRFNLTTLSFFSFFLLFFFCQMMEKIVYVLNIVDTQTCSVVVKYVFDMNEMKRHDMMVYSVLLHNFLVQYLDYYYTTQDSTYDIVLYIDRD